LRPPFSPFSSATTRPIAPRSNTCTRRRHTAVVSSMTPGRRPSRCPNRESEKQQTK
jgi:hypothetical protein